MEENLSDKLARGMEEVEKCKVILKLLECIEDGERIGFEPKDIQWDGAKVRIERGGAENLIFQPPEVIRALVLGQERELNVGKPQCWFTLGMFAYWMYYQENYYTRNRIRVLYHALHGSDQDVVIAPEEAEIIPFRGAVSKWTSWESEKREEGVREFIDFIETRYPEIEENAAHENSREDLNADDSSTRNEPSRAGRRLYIRKAYLTGRQSDYNNLIQFLKLDERNDANRVNLKMSYPSCECLIIQTDKDGTPRLVDQFAVLKPENFSGSEYSLALRYDAERNCVFAEISSGGTVIRRSRAPLK